MRIFIFIVPFDGCSLCTFLSLKRSKLLTAMVWPYLIWIPCFYLLQFRLNVGPISILNKLKNIPLLLGAKLLYKPVCPSLTHILFTHGITISLFARYYWKKNNYRTFLAYLKKMFLKKIRLLLKCFQLVTHSITVETFLPFCLHIIYLCFYFFLTNF